MSTETPVLFIHGLWLHASSWAPWSERFAAAGYRTSAPGWPGDSADRRRSASPSGRHRRSRHRRRGRRTTRKLIAALPAKPILDRPLVRRHDRAEAARRRSWRRAAVAIDAAQIKGVLPLPLSALRATLPVFKNPANKHAAVELTRRAVPLRFGNALPMRSPSDLFERWSDPGARPAALRGGRRRTSTRTHRQRSTRTTIGPRAAVADDGGKDHTVPEAVTTRDAEAVRGTRGSHRTGRVPRPGPLAHGRQRVGEGRRRGARLAEAAGPVMPACDREPGHGS